MQDMYLNSDDVKDEVHPVCGFYRGFDIDFIWVDRADFDRITRYMLPVDLMKPNHALDNTSS